MNPILSLVLASLIAAPAFAADAVADDQAPGHWIWLSEPIPGPRAGLPTTRRHVWVPDQPNVAAQGKGPGHWQWISGFSAGPRSGAPIRHRIWVSQ